MGREDSSMYCSLQHDIDVLACSFSSNGMIATAGGFVYENTIGSDAYAVHLWQ